MTVPGKSKRNPRTDLKLGHYKGAERTASLLRRAGRMRPLHFFQQGDEMEAAAYEQGERKRVERHCGGPLGDGEAALREGGFPLLAAQIVVGQTHAMGTVAHPVHELQRLEVEGVFAEMVFDQHEA